MLSRSAVTISSVVARAEDDNRCLRPGAQRGNNFVALHIRQVEVQQDQAGLERHGELGGLFAGQAFLHLEIGSIENALQHFPGLGFGIHDQESGLLFRHSNALALFSRPKVDLCSVFPVAGRGRWDLPRGRGFFTRTEETRFPSFTPGPSAIQEQHYLKSRQNR